MSRIFVLCFLLISSEVALGCRDQPAFQVGNSSGEIRGLFLTEADFRSSPRWEPKNGNPPLSVERVVKIALEWARTEYAQYDSVNISKISLTEYRCGDRAPRWYYLVQLTLILNGTKAMGAGGGFVAVLFDGSTIGTTEISRGRLTNR